MTLGPWDVQVVQDAAEGSHQESLPNGGTPQRHEQRILVAQRLQNGAADVEELPEAFSYLGTEGHVAALVELSLANGQHRA